MVAVHIHQWNQIYYQLPRGLPMKHLWTIFLLLLIVGTGSMYAQSGELSIRNVQLNDDEISFDVYLKSTTTSTIYLTDMSIYFSFDNSKFTDAEFSFTRGTLSVATYGLVHTLYNVSPTMIGIDIYDTVSPTTTNTAKLPTVDWELKLGTVTLAGITDFTGDLDLQWGAVVPFVNKVYRWEPSTNLEELIDLSLASLPVINLSEPVAINVRTMLEGAHSVNGVMSTVLHTQGLLSTTDPYGKDVHVADIPANVVDWVLLELRSATNPAIIIADTVGFLTTTGEVVALDGKGQILMSPNSVTPGEYYIAIRHRNHVAIMSSMPIELFQKSSPLYDFTTGQNKAFSSTQAPMIRLSSGPDIFGMVAGDANQDGIVNSVDRVNVRNGIGSTGRLSEEDMSLDGTIDASDKLITLTNSFRRTQIP
jgi:hypothetical protein